MDFTHFGQSAIAAIAASGLTFALLKSSLERTLRYAYDRKLVAFKNELELAQKQTLIGVELTQKQRLLEFQDNLTKDNALHSNAHAAFAAGQKAAMERRLDAIATLWRTVVDIGRATPLIVSFLDVADNEKVAELPLTERYQRIIQPPNQTAALGTDCDSIRLFVGEKLWLLFEAYRGIYAMKLFMFATATNMREVVEANRSPYLEPLIKSALTDQEFEEFNGRKQGKWGWLRLLLEAKIAAAADDVISGRDFGTASITEIVRLSEAINKGSNMNGLPKDLAL